MCRVSPLSAVVQPALSPGFEVHVHFLFIPDGLGIVLSQLEVLVVSLWSENNLSQSIEVYVICFAPHS